MKIKIFVYGGGFGNGLSTVLTSKSRLTVQNEPLITYPIQSLVHCGTTEITVFIRKSDFEEVSKILLSKFKNTKFEFCETDDSWGSAQCLRHYFETHKIQETDILLVSGDYIGPLDIDSLLLTHRQVGKECVVDGPIVLTGETSDKTNPTIKKTTIGSDCKMGIKVKITNSIIGSKVTVGDKCKIDNSVIGSNSIIENDVELKNCCVAEYAVVVSDKYENQELISDETPGGC
eukprot:GHVL01015102.1.p1 GENE.GHVL01015102.1~~GHVL01015102.1.p1  ORF type:complete len:232 (+),score=44.19 GHVL01015102.1:23-718(+)